MKKLLSFTVSLLALVLILTACSTKNDSHNKKEKTTIKVASHTSPMTDMLEMIKEDLQKEGYNLEIVKVSDNVQANIALNNKEVDANFFQHKPFMEQFNQKNNAHLVAVQPIYNATVSFYSKNIKDIKDLKNGADIAIPSDPTNLARALRLLAHAKVITLNNPDSFTVTENDIKDNPKNLKFTKVSLLNLNEAYNEKDLVFNYPTYISKLGLTPDKNGLILEKDGDLTFAISIVAREDNKDDKKITALKKALASEKIKDYINKELKPKGHATPAF
ncbi:NLPA lipoprotein [Gemella bergeri ATCC 700627]|uniref:Lipoprotein n=1 Tax=Gemella bergeri ATCC 700627 TaxID=1321820 RepID=U2S441_9BACL|nr:MetQ/NlpA family ABC transporter substrate-binding protein [Gemella bergeri]ERK60453.1 NLPA lipoprotein [Gemella bergeri ATCC 700627]